MRDGARQTEETEIKEGGDGEGDKLPINSFHYPVAAEEYSSLIDSLSITAPRPPFFLSPFSTLMSPFSRICLSSTSIIRPSCLKPPSLEEKKSAHLLIEQPRCHLCASLARTSSLFTLNAPSLDQTRALNARLVTAFDGLLTRRSL